MRKFILGFLMGSLIFGGAIFAREKIVDFSETSVELLNEMIRKIWYAIEDKIIQDSTPSLEYLDTDDNKGVMVHVDFDDTANKVYAIYYGTNYIGSDFDISTTYRKPVFGIGLTGEIFAPYMATGTDQADAGAEKGELYVDENDGFSIKMGQ